MTQRSNNMKSKINVYKLGPKKKIKEFYFKKQNHKFGISLLGDIDYLQWQQKLQFLYPVPSFLVYIWIV